MYLSFLNRDRFRSGVGSLGCFLGCCRVVGVDGVGVDEFSGLFQAQQ